MSLEMHKATRVHVGPQGRVVLPAAMRRELEIEPGDSLVAWLEGDRIVLRSRAALLREIRDDLKDIQGSLADELIAERRAEAARERAAD